MPRCNRARPRADEAVRGVPPRLATGVAVPHRQGFAVAREIINYWADPVDLPTLVNRSKLPINRLQRRTSRRSRRWGRGSSACRPRSWRAYFFANPYFPAEAFLVRVAPDGTPMAVGIGLESPTYADVKKIDPLAPCFRLGAFGTEGLNTKRVNGLFSYLVARPGAMPDRGPRRS